VTGFTTCSGRDHYPGPGRRQVTRKHSALPKYKQAMMIMACLQALRRLNLATDFLQVSG